MLPFGVRDIAAHDNATRAAYEANLANPMVFKAPETDGCRAAYKKLICGMAFADCDGKMLSGCNQVIIINIVTNNRPA